MFDVQVNERHIRDDRGKRYGSPDDALSNVAEFGADGAIVSFWECARRIRNMYGKDKSVADLENAVMDGRNYLAYILCLETRENPDVHVCACAVNQTYDPPVDEVNVKSVEIGEDGRVK